MHRGHSSTFCGHIGAHILIEYGTSALHRLRVDWILHETIKWQKLLQYATTTKNKLHNTRQTTDSNTRRLPHRGFVPRVLERIVQNLGERKYISGNSLRNTHQTLTDILRLLRHLSTFVLCVFCSHFSPLPAEETGNVRLRLWHIRSSLNTLTAFSERSLYIWRMFDISLRRGRRSLEKGVCTCFLSSGRLAQ